MESQEAGSASFEVVAEHRDMLREDDVTVREERSPPRRSSPPPAPPATLENGASVAGRYVVLGAIGQGAMGAVMLSPTTRNSCGVSRMKVLLTTRIIGGEGAFGWSARQRHLRNYIASGTSSRFTTSVRTTPTSTLAMEWLEGEPAVEPWLKSPRPWREVLAVMAQAGAGLGAAHPEAGMIHRDFKPQNVVLGSDGRVPGRRFPVFAAVAGEVSQPRIALSTSAPIAGVRRKPNPILTPGLRRRGVAGRAFPKSSVRSSPKRGPS